MVSKSASKLQGFAQTGDHPFIFLQHRFSKIAVLVIVAWIMSPVALERAIVRE
jgi:hypothetical protein